MTHLRLSLEPIPMTSRLASLAKLMPPAQWNKLRRAVYRRAGYRCQTCGHQGQLHCHEVWQYNPQTGYQWLRGFQALCLLCHGVKHLTFVRDYNRRDQLLNHFAAVNRLTREQAEQCLRDAQRIQHQLDQRQWIISYGDYNLRMPALANLQQRRQYVKLSHPQYSR